MYTPGEARSLDTAFVSAIKADDAKNPTYLWNERIWELGSHTPQRVALFKCNRKNQCPLDVIRGALLRVWRSRVRKSLLAYLVKTYGEEWYKAPTAIHDREVGRECITRTGAADWWEWRGGSTLFFWRWPPYLKSLVTEGHPSWLKGELPKFLQPQRGERDKDVGSKVKQKLDNILAKGYISKGTVTSLTSYFAVPKGSDDIRIVYDATRSGLNKVLWAPSFPLPSVDTLTDMVEPTSWMADLDMGEQFLNFPLDVQLRASCGIDVRPYLAPNSKSTLWFRWVRCMMGLSSSPYVVVKSTHLADESALGDRHNLDNPFQWEYVRLNLPGMDHYNPHLPWVSRMRADHSLAAGVARYLDDQRPVGNSQEDCWKVAHTIAARYGYLGLQITSRKMHWGLVWSLCQLGSRGCRGFMWTNQMGKGSGNNRRHQTPAPKL
jgi:hypothetical protein